ncbi:SUMF1/EgtB/PvdO family nonheme iron enzyme [uncultured Desulfobacter sp.]|uniref:formylglycine-generating enzyme family protein n=1 Tax=uncultured Desulfobacter sp. TaxID=240139 RepID=UPI002AAB15BB|nr:SUMF1/EgtB/PvdO family nonheme iron enzyme [uncultured Desulfobacter sp.]
MASVSITLSGITEAVENLNYRPGSVKDKAIRAIAAYYVSEDSIASLSHIDGDRIIRQIWETGDDPAKIRSKRRNFSSLKSSINADLKKLSQTGLNPEDVTLTESNVFDMTQDAKSNLLQSFSDAVKTDGFDLTKATDVLKAVAEFLDKFKSSDTENESTNIIEEIKKVLDRLGAGVFDDQKGAGGDGEGVLEDDVEIEEIDDDTEIEEIDDDELEEVEELDEDAEVEEIELDEDEELEEVDEDLLDADIEEIDEDTEIEEIDDDELEEVEELDEDAEVEEIELDEDEELEEVDEDLLDADIEEIDEDTEIEEIDDDELEEVEELDEDAEVEEIELDEDEELEEVDEDLLDADIEEIDEDTEIEEIDDDELEEVEELDEDAEVEEIELDEGEDLEELEEIDEDTEIEDVELDEDESLEEIEDIELDADEQLEVVDLGEDEDLEELDELDEEEINALDEFRKSRELAQQFDDFLGEREKKFNSYITIPGGTYTIGTEKSLKSSLALQPFDMPTVYMGKYPVTNALFEIFIEQTGYVTTAERRGVGTVYHSRFKKQGEKVIWSKQAGSSIVKGACWYQPLGPGSTLHGKRNHPVVQISVDDAFAYASWIGRRLPTEAEWEAAARTDMAFKYPWGNEFDPKLLNIESSGFADTSPVDEYDHAANVFGMADMLGNVMEWTTDTQPPPFETRKARMFNVAKGGGWNAKDSISISSRGLFPAEITANIIGFRCISELFQ